ncbi:MAG: ammonia-forming cytochrome c nitrite reductase subunit c552 [Elusimicrobia bacterium]|nr:ammonia-forming cytochrome c nitrite reductase subunit c552 [Elusimicrobiota bacterium]
MKNKTFLLTAGMILAAAGIALVSCSKKAEPFKTAKIDPNDYEPSNWGKVYPLQHELWEKTKEPTAEGKSRYKKGFDADKVTYDKLSEFPYMALLFNGWGFGIEYNEPRGHYHMLKDVLEIDASRRKAGGVCLTCKTPYARELQTKYGKDYFSKAFAEIHALIPKNHSELGVACISCHDGEDMSLKILNDFTLGNALRAMGADTAKLSRQDMRSLVCAQCHVTYSIIKDRDMKSVGVVFPWKNGKHGKITIEDIIKTIKEDPSLLEWKQVVTGFKIGFIRHPEYELFSNDSVHWKAGLACADCHMPYVRSGSYKISDHRVMSPLKKDLKACIVCHTEGADWLRQRVYSIQDRTASLMLRAGYATATAAKLFEITHKGMEEGKRIDKSVYEKAKDYYLEAFYRTTFVGAENSMGFHNPQEAMRILGDAVAFANRSEILLRHALAKAAIDVPEKIDLELKKYLNDRGEKKLKFNPKFEIKDPFKTHERF